MIFPKGGSWWEIDGLYFRSRLVAFGYSQVTGVDFHHHFSPVPCDTSFKTTLLMIQKLKLAAWSINVEAAFLNGDLSEDIYRRVPQGFAKVHGTENAI